MTPATATELRRSGDHVLPTGTPSAMVVTLSPAPTVLRQGMTLMLRLPLSSTGWTENPGPVTINVNGLGAAEVRTLDTLPLKGGELKPNGAFLFFYSSPAWYVVGSYEAASVAEARAGTNRTRFITPETLKAVLPQRVAFDQYFSDDNPLVLAHAHYDPNNDPNVLPASAVRTYQYAYASAFPDEMSLINVILLSNIRVTRPGSASINAYARGRALNAGSVNRNNYVFIDSGGGAQYDADSSKSVAYSMIVAKPTGKTIITLQEYVWWSAQQAGVGGVPYQVFVDDIEMFIIERAVSALPTYLYAD